MTWAVVYVVGGLVLACFLYVNRLESRERVNGNIIELPRMRRRKRK